MHNFQDFIFNNHLASDLGVSSIEVSSLFESDFSHSRSVNTTFQKSLNKSWINSIERQPLVFEVKLLFDGNLDEVNMRQVKQWLYTDNYSKLKFVNSDFEVYAICDGEIKIVHNGIDTGYITVTFLTNSPYKFGSPKTLDGYCTDEQSITIFNYGDMDTTFNLKFVMSLAGGSVEVQNETDDGKIQIFKLINNLENETIIINGAYEQIDTSSKLSNPYARHNNQFINFKVGENKLKLIGTFAYETNYQEVYY